MLPFFFYSSNLFALLIVVGELSVILDNVNASGENVKRNVKRELLFPMTEMTNTEYHTINENGGSIGSKSNIFKRFEEPRSIIKNEKSGVVKSKKNINYELNNANNGTHDKTRCMNLINKQLESIDEPEEPITRVKRTKTDRITKDDISSRNISRKYLITREPFFRDGEQRFESFKAPCTSSFTIESSSSLRRSFHVPRVRKFANCSSQKRLPTWEETGPSIGIRSIDRGHADLVDQYEKEQSMDDIGSELIHPEGHGSRSPRKIILTRSIVESQREKNLIPNNSSRYYDRNELVRTFFKTKRNVKDMILADSMKRYSLRKRIMEKSKNQMQNTTAHYYRRSNDFDQINATENPWPLVPGPISCELDFQLQPSFVAKLGEFDYVVSVHRQRNPDESAVHVCTGVIYNPRFVLIASHCLNDNYGLAVTSTDDLCTIDEMIDVDYVIEHEHYDDDSRRNDIALIKLKSEIHKRAAIFSIKDDAIEKYFYAVGFGELMWKTFPNKVIKRLQKVPVRRHLLFKEVIGTLHVTTSHMDLTGAFRGDFGGALTNSRGELVGLKSKFVKKSSEYVVYTRVRTYLPWIKSMVALHGSW